MTLAIALAESLPDLHWIDWTGLSLLGLFTLLGVLRGLWWQVVRLVGLAASVALARTFAGDAALRLEGWTGWAPEIAGGVAWVGLFVVGLVVTALVGTLGKKSLQAMQLGLVDRAGGGAVGLATGALVHISLLVALAHLGPQPWTEEALRGTFSREALKLVTTRYPVVMQVESQASGSWLRWLEEATAEEAEPGSVR